MDDKIKKSNIEMSKLVQQSALQKDAVDKAEIQAVVAENRKVVEIIAKSMLKQKKIPQGICYDDLFSWGIEGLIKAFKSYKPKKNATFKTYASIRIKGEMLDQLRKEWNYRSSGSNFLKEKKNLERRIGDFLDHTNVTSATSLLDCSGMIYLLSIDECDNKTNSIPIEDKSDSLEKISESNDQKSKLWQKVETLSVEEKQIIQMFYIHNKTQTEISGYLKLSQSKVCRIHSKLLIKLKKALEDEEFVY